MFKVKVFHNYGHVDAYPHVTSHPYCPMTRAYAFALARRLSGQKIDSFAYAEVYTYDGENWIPALCPAMHEAAMRGEPAWYEVEFPWQE